MTIAAPSELLFFFPFSSLLLLSSDLDRYQYRGALVTTTMFLSWDARLTVCLEPEGSVTSCFSSTGLVGESEPPKCGSLDSSLDKGFCPVEPGCNGVEAFGEVL